MGTQTNFNPNGQLLRLAINAVDFIEENLSNPISVKDVTAQFEKSHWEFQRLFASVVGVTLGQYLRERRLTEASKILADGKNRLLDVAVQFDFGSEEAFRRSFKNYFGMNPSDYRSRDQFILRESRNKIDREKLDFFWSKIHRTPEIVNCRKRTLVGTSIEFQSHFVLGSSCHAKVIPHWAEFKTRMDSIPHRTDDQRIGAILTTELDLREERLTYFSGVEVNQVAEMMPGMHSMVLPEGLYACFENRVQSDKHSHLIDYVYGIWLPSSSYTRGPGHDFDIFDQSYTVTNPQSMSRFYVPVVEKA